MIELMKELCALPGPSGCEDAVRAFVLKRVKPFADEIRTDAIGNVMVFRKGRKALDRPVAVCAHMDEVGVIIKKITEDGMLKFGFVGGVDPRVVIGRPVRFGDVPGVIGIKAVHLTTAAERRTMPKTKNLYIDIGATSRAAAEKLVSLGDYGVFDSAVVEFGDGLIKAKAIDDRVGCAALLRLPQHLQRHAVLGAACGITALQLGQQRGMQTPCLSVMRYAQQRRVAHQLLYGMINPHSHRPFRFLCFSWYAQKNRGCMPVIHPLYGSKSFCAPYAAQAENV